jgi:hypothetical protein
MHHRAREVLRYQQRSVSTRRPTTEPEPLENERADGRDDPVVRGVLRNAVVGVLEHDVDLLVAGGAQARAGTGLNVGIDVDGGDRIGRADEFGDQGGVVSARASIAYSRLL